MPEHEALYDAVYVPSPLSTTLAYVNDLPRTATANGCPPLPSRWLAVSRASIVKVAGCLAIADESPSPYATQCGTCRGSATSCARSVEQHAG